MPLCSFSTHGAWLRMSCCLISSEKQSSPDSINAFKANNFTNKNHLKICVAVFINTCGDETEHEDFCDVYIGMDAGSLWLNRGFIPCVFTFYSFCSFISI